MLSRLALVLLAVFVLLFPTAISNSGLLGYTCVWLFPLGALFAPPVYDAGKFWTFYFHFTGIATALALMLLAAACLYAWRPKVARDLCYVAGLLSAPIGLIAVYIGLKLAEEVARLKPPAPALRTGP